MVLTAGTSLVVIFSVVSPLCVTLTANIKGKFERANGIKLCEDSHRDGTNLRIARFCNNLNRMFSRLSSQFEQTKLLFRMHGFTGITLSFAFYFI